MRAAATLAAASGTCDSMNRAHGQKVHRGVRGRQSPPSSCAQGARWMVVTITLSRSLSITVSLSPTRLRNLIGELQK